MQLKLYNSLSRQLEEFKPINPAKVGIYCCGPTVYSFVTIGNFRTYFLGDMVVRVLKYLGYHVDYVMNITDVGHLTGDNLGDADTGEDRLEKAARKERKTAWDIAKFYTNDFLKGYKQLNLTSPRLFTKATDHILEQIELIKTIDAKGFTYIISDGVYFDVLAFEKAGYKYGQLSTLDNIQAGARIKKNPEKKDPRDFALWKFTPKNLAIKRQMEWESPWGIGFPGWHIECSAMAMKYLGEQFDIHVGGEDLRSTHHPNEISQSEAVTGKIPFVKYWLHGAFLLVDSGRMGKSLGNAYTLTDIISKGFDPLALRYFYFTGHYRKQLNFTWEGLEAAEKALQRLKVHTMEFRRLKSAIADSNKIDNNKNVIANFSSRFQEAISNDLNIAQALDILWQMIKSNLIPGAKYKLLLDWDKILGLDLDKDPSTLAGMTNNTKIVIDKKIEELVKYREQLRKEKKWKEVDEIRQKIADKGFLILDTGKGTIIKKKKTYDVSK